MSADEPSNPPAKRERRLAKTFRWQAFFERCAEPLFVLDRRRRLRYVNRAWETLTGLSAEQAHVLVCRRSRPVTADDSAEDILAHAMTPPPDVLRGASGRVRRLLPNRQAAARWWEVEFWPLLQEGEQGGHIILGRIRPMQAVELVRDHALSEKLVNLRQRRLERFGLDAWTSSVPTMRRLVEQVRLASQVNTPVLLVGESGTGKQTLARTIHAHSARRDGACAVLDCENLPPAAVAALLTGDGSSREGLTSIYLREPAFLPRDVQLLLAERITRGSDAESPRILAGCATPPAQAVREGRLLDELACALGTLILEVPPLRHHLNDLPDLVQRLLERACAGRETRVTSLSADAWTILRSYTWPGNIRELYTILRDACVRANGEQIRVTDLPAALRRAVQREQTPPRSADGPLPLEQLLEEAERRLIQLALQRAGGRKARAARILSIPRPRLWRRMVKLGIADTEKESDAEAEGSEPQE
jgi:DNA-binding NtrC family response regulator